MWHGSIARCPTMARCPRSLQQWRDRSSHCRAPSRGSSLGRRRRTTTWWTEPAAEQLERGRSDLWIWWELRRRPDDAVGSVVPHDDHERSAPLLGVVAGLDHDTMGELVAMIVDGHEGQDRVKRRVTRPIRLVYEHASVAGAHLIDHHLVEQRRARVRRDLPQPP